MLLAIDVGNTDTKLGFWEGEQLVHTWRVTTSRRRTSDEYGILFASLFAQANVPLEAVGSIVISSVVPSVNRALGEGCRRYFARTPSFFSAASQLVLEIRTDRPAELGSDMTAAAIGAKARYGAPAIVIGFGTATTFAAISPDGAFLGTAIAPGIQVSIDALNLRTAQLPQVALDAEPPPFGRETITSLRAGIIWGFVGQTEGIVTRMKPVLGEGVRVIATGGLAPVVAPYTRTIDAVDPDLTLLGLRLADEAARPA